MAKVAVRIWMLNEGLKASKLAAEYGCARPFMSIFLEGVGVSSGLVKFFIKKGCPAKYFNNSRVVA